MAKLEKTNGQSSEVLPKNGRDFSLEELYAHIGTTDIEVVHLQTGGIMIVHGSGHIVGLPYNEAATRLYQNGRIMHETIVGDALVCKRGEID